MLHEHVAVQRFLCKLAHQRHRRGRRNGGLGGRLNMEHCGSDIRLATDPMPPRRERKPGSSDLQAAKLAAMKKVMEDFQSDVVRHLDKLHQILREAGAQTDDVIMSSPPALGSDDLRTIRQAVGLKSDRCAELLLLLVQHPDRTFGYSELTGDPIPTKARKNVVRVHLTQLRTALRELGFEAAIQNHRGYGYYINLDVAAEIQKLWKK